MSQLMKLSDVRILATRLTGLCGGAVSAYMPWVGATPFQNLAAASDLSNVASDALGFWILKFADGKFGANAGLIKDRLDNWGANAGMASLKSESRYWDDDQDLFRLQIGDGPEVKL